MCTYPGWPYSAKAVIQHEFDTDHLNIWMTFGYPMCIESIPPGETEPVPVKPDNDKWIVKADNVEKVVAESNWEDKYSLVLTVPNVSTLPDRVTVKFDGPDEKLRISWNKQWEPWGPILSLNITT